jgi:hypothetical protein
MTAEIVPLWVAVRAAPWPAASHRWRASAPSHVVAQTPPPLRAQRPRWSHPPAATRGRCAAAARLSAARSLAGCFGAEAACRARCTPDGGRPGTREALRRRRQCAASCGDRIGRPRRWASAGDHAAARRSPVEGPWDIASAARPSSASASGASDRDHAYCTNPQRKQNNDREAQSTKGSSAMTVAPDAVVSSCWTSVVVMHGFHDWWNMTTAETTAETLIEP